VTFEFTLSVRRSPRRMKIIKTALVRKAENDCAKFKTQPYDFAKIRHWLILTGIQ